MKVMSTQSFKDRLIEPYIAKIVDVTPGEKFPYKKEWIKRFDLDKKARESDTFEKKLHGQIIKYHYQFEIKEIGIYEFFKIDDVNDSSPDKKAVMYVLPDECWGDYIKYKNIQGLLNSLKNREKIDLDNLRNY